MAEAPRPGPHLLLEDMKRDIEILGRFLHGTQTKESLARWASRDPKVLQILETALRAIQAVDSMVTTEKENDTAEVQKNIDTQSTALRTNLDVYMATHPDYLTTEANLFNLLETFANYSRNNGSYVEVKRKIGDAIQVIQELPPGVVKTCQIEGNPYAVIANFHSESRGSIRVYKQYGKFWYLQ